MERGYRISTASVDGSEDENEANDGGKDVMTYTWLALRPVGGHNTMHGSTDDDGDDERDKATPAGNRSSHHG
jgi:hypothetical protein